MGLEDTAFVGLPPSSRFLTVVCLPGLSIPWVDSNGGSSSTEMRYTSNP